MTKKILFDGQNSDQQQIKKIYEKLGEPLQEWPEAKDYPFWSELQPQIRYLNTLETYLRSSASEPLPDSAIDIIRRMLAWNPKQRLSATEALAHEFFRSDPPPCHPNEFPEFKKEYHYISLQKAERNEKRSQLF